MVDYFIHSYLVCHGGEKSRLRRAQEIGMTYLYDRKSETLKKHFYNHPDVLLIEPDPESKSSSITIGQIRELERKVNLKPYSAAYKVAIVKGAQRMTTEAQNALLKTLEEPPARSVLILTAPHTRLLLPTIVSRCQKEVLKPEVEIDIASEVHRTAVEDFLKILEMDLGKRLSWVETNKKLTGDRQAAVSLLNSWISVLRDLVLIKEGLGGQVLNKGLVDTRHPERSEGPPQDRDGILLPTLRRNQNDSGCIEKAIEIRRVVSTTSVNQRLGVERLLLEL